MADKEQPKEQVEDKEEYTLEDARADVQYLAQEIDTLKAQMREHTHTRDGRTVGPY